MRTRSREKTHIGHRRKIGFVCSGGATKAGAFHLGVALALREQGFQFYGGTKPSSGEVRPPGPMEISTYVGSSAGSIIASYLAAGYSLDNIFNSFLGRKLEEPIDPIDIYPKPLPRLTYQTMFRLRSKSTMDKMGQLSFLKKTVSGVLDGDMSALLQLKWLKTTGIFSTAGIEEYMRNEVLPSNRFEDYPADLFIVGTQLNHSRKVVFGKYSYQPPPWDLSCQYDNAALISDACAASTALPGVYSPHVIMNSEGQPVHYIDGEIRDTLSTHVAIDSGADLVIASYTHKPYHYTREIGSLTNHGLPAMLIQAIYLVIEQKINAHIYNRKVHRAAISEVSKYCKENGVSEEHRKRIMGIMEQELHHRMDTEVIYIHPSPNDVQTFFGEHFSLSPKKMSEIVKSGFKACIETLRRYEFADRKKGLQVGSAG